VATVSNSIITKDGTRGTFSWDPESLSVAAKFTDSLGAEYTQNLDDGNFFKSDGTWLGEENQLSVKQAFGQSANLELGDPDIRKTLDKYAEGLNVYGTNDDGGGSTESGKSKGKTIDFSKSAKDASVAAARKKYDDNLRYPLAELPDDVDFMRITMKKYIAGKFKSGRKNRASERAMETLGTVLLPIPPTLADSNTTNWGESSMNNLQMAGAAAATKVMNPASGGFKGFGEEISGGINNFIDMAKNDKGEVGQYAKTALMSQIAGLGNNTAQLLARSQGKVINPNLELLFTGPARRAFNYSFRLTARSEKETIRIKKIIRFFKQGMSAKQSAGSGLYLDTPNIFDVCFHAGRKAHPFLFKMKRTAITGFTVNYVPDGTYMTLPNKSMTAYEIQMSMQELDPIFDQDYTDLDGNNDSMIGY